MPAPTIERRHLVEAVRRNVALLTAGLTGDDQAAQEMVEDFNADIDSEFEQLVRGVMLPVMHRMYQFTLFAGARINSHEAAQEFIANSWPELAAFMTSQPEQILGNNILIFNAEDGETYDPS